MRPYDLAALSVGSLAQHAFRSFLTVLGIVFGVGALVAMLAIAEGARRKTIQDLNTLGVDNLVVLSVKPSGADQKIREGEEQIDLQVYGLTGKDRLRFEGFDNVRRVIGIRDLRRDVYARGKRTDLRVLATEPGFIEATRSRLLAGRFLTETDMAQRNSICVLGREAADTLFPRENPVGSWVRVSDRWYRVAGISDTPSTITIGSGGSLNRGIFVPSTTTDAAYGKRVYRISGAAREAFEIVYDALLVQVLSLGPLAATADRLRSALKATHGLADTQVVVPYDLVRQSERSQRIFAIVMGAIAGISLVVGGIGVANIMLANVYERTREIGTCLAIGARRGDILRQFLTEATLLAGVGGLLGLGLGIGMAAAVTSWAGWETALTPLALALALGISGGIGILAGTYPAWRASRLSPIEALRHE